MTQAVLDTSVLIAGDRVTGFEGVAISTASLAELHFGALAAKDPEDRAGRIQRLGFIEATFQSLPLDEHVAREWGKLAAAVARRGGRPRKRAMDLVIAATANAAGVPLVTRDAKGLAIVSDLVDVRKP